MEAQPRFLKAISDEIRDLNICIEIIEFGCIYKEICIKLEIDGPGSDGHGMTWT